MLASVLPIKRTTMLAFDHSFFRTRFDNGSDLILCLAADQSLLYASPSCTRALGWQSPELLTFGLPSLAFGPGEQGLQQAVSEALIATDPPPPFMTRLHHKNGAAVPVEVEIHPERGKDVSHPTRLLLVMRLSEEDKTPQPAWAKATEMDQVEEVNDRAFHNGPSGRDCVGRSADGVWPNTEW